MPKNLEIMEWLAAGLTISGKTQRGLANALGVDPATICRMLQGTRRLRVDEIEPAARYLGVKPPRGYLKTSPVTTGDFIDIPLALRTAIVAKAMDMGIEPEEFVARAVRAALTVVGSHAGGERY